jgi:pimeloyl-ACP methyl ester carboxylesterase
MRTASITTVPTRQGRALTVRHWPGEGRPLVLLHGLMDSSEGWTWLAEASAHPCIAIDLPGFGGSDRATSPRVTAFAEDIVDVLAALSIEHCTLIGHSLGGAVAAEVAERCERIASLALLAPVGFGAVRLAEAFTLPVVRDVATLALPMVFANPLLITAAYAAFVANGRLPERELIERLIRRGGCAPAAVRDATMAIAHAGRAPDALFRRRLSFAGPVDALWGKADALVDHSHSDALRAALPQAAVEVWEGMGHHPQRERPRDLEHFLARHTVRVDDPPLRAPGAAAA